MTLEHPLAETSPDEPRRVVIPNGLKGPFETLSSETRSGIEEVVASYNEAHAADELPPRIRVLEWGRNIPTLVSRDFDQQKMPELTRSIDLLALACSFYLSRSLVLDDVVDHDFRRDSLRPEIVERAKGDPTIYEHLRLTRASRNMIGDILTARERLATALSTNSNAPHASVLRAFADQFARIIGPWETFRLRYDSYSSEEKEAFAKQLAPIAEDFLAFAAQPKERQEEKEQVA